MALGYQKSKVEEATSERYNSGTPGILFCHSPRLLLNPFSSLPHQCPNQATEVIIMQMCGRGTLKILSTILHLRMVGVGTGQATGA